MDRAAGKCGGRNDEQPVRSFISKQNNPFRIGREYSGGAAFDKHLQLLFRIAPGFDLTLDLDRVLRRAPAAADHLINEEPHAEKRGEDQNVSRDSSGEVPVEAVEQLR